MAFKIKKHEKSISLDYDEVFSQIVNRGRSSCRQLADHFGVSFVRMSRFLAKMQAYDENIKTEWVKKGDGEGYPSQELIYKYKQPKEDE